MLLKLSLATLLVGFSVLAQGLVSTYSSIQLKKCSHYLTGEGGDSATCVGPQNIGLEFAAGDWTNMWIHYKGKKFETWELVISAGSWNRIGGDNQVVEWILDNSVEGQSRVHSLIARVSGTHPQTQITKSKLLVFGFTSLGVCYRGESVSNLGARQLAESTQCLKNLPVSLPTPSLKNRYESLQTSTIEREMVTQEYKASINSVRMMHAQVTANGKGTFEVEVNYCASRLSKTPAEISVTGTPTAFESVILGGSPSTLHTIPSKFAYTIQVPKGVAIADACKESTIVLKLPCNIQPGFSGAGCNYKINDEQIIAVESFKSGYNGVLLLAVQ